MIRILTLNVNGIRSAASKGLFRWLRKAEADVVCLQEVKADEVDIPEALALSRTACMDTFTARSGAAIPALRCTPSRSRARFGSASVRLSSMPKAAMSKPSSAT